jgi:hypothetical protein
MTLIVMICSVTPVVVHTASAQLLAAAQSIAAGVAKRKSQGKCAYLIHVQSFYLLNYIFVPTSSSPTS